MNHCKTSLIAALVVFASAPALATYQPESTISVSARTYELAKVLCDRAADARGKELKLPAQGTAFEGQDTYKCQISVNVPSREDNRSWKPAATAQPHATAEPTDAIKKLIAAAPQDCKAALDTARVVFRAEMAEQAEQKKAGKKILADLEDIARRFRAFVAGLSPDDKTLIRAASENPDGRAATLASAKTRASFQRAFSQCGLGSGDDTFWCGDVAAILLGSYEIRLITRDGLSFATHLPIRDTAPVTLEKLISDAKGGGLTDELESFESYAKAIMHVSPDCFEKPRTERRAQATAQAKRIAPTAVADSTVAPTSAGAPL